LLDDEHAEVRNTVVTALGNLHAEKAVPALLKMLRDKERDVQQSAALALSRMHVQDAALAQWQDQRLAELDASLKAGLDSQAKVAEQLGYIITPTAVTTLSGWLNDTDSQVLTHILNTLVNIAAIQPRWLEAHIARFIELAHHDRVEVQQAAANALAALAAQTADRPSEISSAGAEQIRQALADLAQDNKLPDSVRLAGIEGLGNSKSETATQVLLGLLQNPQQSNLHMPTSYWLAQLAYRPALPLLKQRLAELEQDKHHWRQQVQEMQTQNNGAEPPAKRQDKSWPDDYRVYQYAYSIARIDGETSGIELLSHPLYAAREAAIQALAEQANGILATRLIASLQAFAPESLPSPRPYATYRALDLVLQQLEFGGGQDDLAALSKPGQVALPMASQQQAVNERLSWTVTELKFRLAEQSQ
jgi:HEAT repeat protein